MIHVSYLAVESSRGTQSICTWRSGQIPCLGLPICREGHNGCLDDPLYVDSSIELKISGSWHQLLRVCRSGWICSKSMCTFKLPF